MLVIVADREKQEEWQRMLVSADVLWMSSSNGKQHEVVVADVGEVDQVVAVIEWLIGILCGCCRGSEIGMKFEEAGSVHC